MTTKSSPLFQVGQPADTSQGHATSGGLSWSRSSSLRKHLSRRSLSSSRIDQVGESNAQSNAIKVRQVITNYRVTIMIRELGCVDSDLQSFPGCQAATVATYCPGSMVEHPKSMSMQPRSQTITVTL